jgi:hypothetical protein
MQCVVEVAKPGPDLRRACACFSGLATIYISVEWQEIELLTSFSSAPAMSSSDIFSGSSSEAEVSGGLSDPNSVQYIRRRSVLDLVNALQSHG